MKRALVGLGLVAAAACGIPQQEGGRLAFDLFVDRAVPDKVASLQVAILSKGKSYDCTQVQRDCLRAQTDGGTSQLVLLSDSSGKQRPALVFPLALADGSQTLQVSGIPVGQDFAVVIEALTKDNPPNLYGSSCNYVKEIAAGGNPTLIAATITAYPGDAGFKACDPRFEK